MACPWCGADAACEISFSFDAYQVECKSRTIAAGAAKSLTVLCNVKGPIWPTQAQAIANWNRVAALRASHERMREEVAAECCAAIRSKCDACSGSGYATHPEHRGYVSHDMASDAGDPSMEGQSLGMDDGTECEYCGRPIAAIRLALSYPAPGGGAT